LGKTDDFSLFE